ncbi:MAG: T9SS type A sorting domain-containing protein, partial [Saprospiraceae bacterium]
SGGGQVPIAFDNELWGYLNQLNCAPTATTEVEDARIRIYPNPTRSGWQLEASNLVDRVDVFDLQGRLLESVAPGRVGSFWLNAAGLPEGVLLLKIWSAGQVSWSKVLKVGG